MAEKRRRSSRVRLPAAKRQHVIPDVPPRATKRIRTSLPAQPPPPKAPSPSPTPPPEVLPTKIEPGPLPTTATPQSVEEVQDFQTVRDSRVLAESIRRSRQAWTHGGVFDRWWAKRKQPDTVYLHNEQSGEKKRSMKEWAKGVKLAVDPHVFHVNLYVVRMDALPGERILTETAPIPFSSPLPSTYTASTAPTPFHYHRVPPYPNPPSHHGTPKTPLSTSASPFPALPGPTPVSPVPTMMTARGPIPPGPPPQQHPPPRNEPPQPPLHAAPDSTPSATRPPPPPAPTPSPVPQQQAAPDPVIHMLAQRASANMELKQVMRIVASGNANPSQLEYFQRHIDELSAIVKARGGHTAHGTPAPPQTNLTPSTATQQPANASPTTAPTPTPTPQRPITTTSAPGPPRPPSNPPAPSPSHTRPQNSPLSGSAPPPPTMKPQPIPPAATGPPIPHPPRQPVPAARHIPGPPPASMHGSPQIQPANPLRPSSTPHPPAPQSMSHPPHTPGSSFGASPSPYPYNGPQQPHAYRQPLPPRPRISRPPANEGPIHLLVEFEDNNNDRWLFPRMSIIEYQPGIRVATASFLVLRDPNNKPVREKRRIAPPPPALAPVTKPAPAPAPSSNHAAQLSPPLANAGAAATPQSLAPAAPISGPLPPTPVAKPAAAPGPLKPRGIPELDIDGPFFYQPVTVRFMVGEDAGFVLSALARAVAPQKDVREYMEMVFAKGTRAPDRFLALRLPKPED